MPTSYTWDLHRPRLRGPRNPGTRIAEFPAIPAAHSFGRTPEEALAHAEEALELVLARLRETGRPLPPDVRTVQVGIDAA